MNAASNRAPHRARTTVALVLLVAVAVPVAAAAGPAQSRDGAKRAGQKKVYCWNDNGRKVCGDALPAEAAASERTEFSATSGRPLAHVERALSAEERAAAATVAGQARLAADAEAARVRRDLAMVESYATEADLRRAFNERIVLVDESIKTSILSEANLRRGLVGLLSQAANLELSGKPVSASLRDDILSMHAELGRQLQLLHDQRADRGTLDSDLAAALQRYRGLKAPAAR